MKFPDLKLINTLRIFEFVFVYCLVYGTVILHQWQLSVEYTFPYSFTHHQVFNITVSMYSVGSYFIFFPVASAFVPSWIKLVD